jgi:hypothetical protein
MSSKVFPPENRAVYENEEKYGAARQATDDTVIWHTRIACWDVRAECG